ncbi:class I SAM-dependent methyltransferase [Colwelliaceae bacterium BS250]
MSNYWSQYWRQGHLTSFGDDIKDNYIGALKQVWLAEFAQVTNEHQVLDLATGNGALIGLLYDNKADGDYPSIDGIDLAEIQISAELLNVSTKTRFSGGVNCENLSFADHSQDLIISQFGIEYANFSKALKEVARVLKPDGRCQFICHHPLSIIVKPNQDILRQSIAIQSSNGGLAIVKQLVKQLQLHGKGSVPSEKSRMKLNKFIEKQTRADDVAFQATNFTALVRTVMNNLNDKALQLSIMNEFEAELKGSIQRLGDLIQACLSPARIKSFNKACQDSGLQINKFEPIKDAENCILGWQINITKS